MTLSLFAGDSCRELTRKVIPTSPETPKARNLASFMSECPVQGWAQKNQALNEQHWGLIVEPSGLNEM